jgi:CxxC motif-containing protein (DUF1111 family)
MKMATRALAALALVLSATSAFAAKCDGFKWDISREKALFATEPVALSAKADAMRAPAVKPETLYALRLLPQEQVNLVAPPSKTSIADGASAGMVRFRVARSGTYRVALDLGFWVDVIADGKPIASTDFSGSPDCRAPRKVVMYALPADQDLVLQFSGAVEPQLRFAITAVALRRPESVGALLGAVLLALTTSPAWADAVVTPQADFVDPRNPPSYRELDPDSRAAFELGQAIFNTQWVPAGTARAQRRDGLGPVFNAASCDACHNNGARMRGPLRAGPTPAGLVIQLQTPGGQPLPYGEVLNTSAIDGHVAEGTAQVRFVEHSGRYPDGAPWSLREPRFEITLGNGKALPAEIVIKPRAAPALFGAGLLDAVPASAITPARQTKPPAGRFGWRLGARSLAEQTAHAFSREMGLTSTVSSRDDCALDDPVCRAAPNGGVPEVSPEFFAAILAFQRWLAVPHAKPTTRSPKGENLFQAVGCAHCHQPTLPVDGVPGLHAITAFTDLRLHDLGAGLADRDGAGRVIASRWRTAPLWGLGHALGASDEAALLHDGRARNAEEAVLWHQGEAEAVRQRFMQLPVDDRQALLDWVSRR